MAFTRRPFPCKVSINLNGNALSTVNEDRHLGLILSSDLRWSAHIDKILSKAGRLLYTIIGLRRTLSRKALILYYSLYIRPVVEYACIAWPKLSAHLRNRLERFQRRAFKVILRKPLFEPSDHDEVLLTLQQPSLESRRQYKSAILGFQLANKTAPQHLLNDIKRACSEINWRWLMESCVWCRQFEVITLAEGAGWTCGGGGGGGGEA